MPRKKVETVTSLTQVNNLTFVINEDQYKKIQEWKKAHNIIFGFCEDSEYDYVFTVDGENKCSLVVKNTYHETELDLSEESE
jgi:hypothetical protein